MADIQAAPSPRRGPRPIQVDMTPMVDLAFLLLTFFILTTTLRRQQGLQLVLPSSGTSTGEKQSVTFLLSGDADIHAYRGAFDADSTRIQRYGLDQVHTAIHAITDTAHFVCIVKTHPTAKYGGVVHVLDEVSYLGAGHYALEEHIGDAERAAWESALAQR